MFLVRPHLSIAGARRVMVKTPDLSLLVGVVAPQVLDAMRTASARLAVLGVRHLGILVAVLVAVGVLAR